MVSATRVGIGLRADAVSVVATRGEDIVWVGAGSFDTDAERESVLIDLLAQVPRRRWGRLRAVAAVGPASCQTRCITGLPPVRDATVATALVRENISRFFLRNGVPVTSAIAVRGADGTWWNAAFEAPLIDFVRAACARNRVKIEAFVPTIAVLAMGITSNEIVWQDRDVTALARFDGGRIVDCRRVRTPADDPSIPFTSALAALGAEASMYVDAYAAAVHGSLRDVPRLPGATDAERTAVPRWRRTVAAAFACTALLAALIAPGLQARMLADRSQAEAARLERAAQQPVTDESDLARFRGALAEFSELAATSAAPVTRLLAVLTRSLPDSTALVSVRVDSAAVQVVVLAPRAATVVATLEKSPLIANPRITGPITREKVSNREVERVTVRFDRR